MTGARADRLSRLCCAQHALNSVTIVDPHSSVRPLQEPATSGAPPAPRGFPAGCVVGHRLLVHGGMTATGRPLRDFFVLDLDTLSWVEVRARAPRCRTGGNG